MDRDSSTRVLADRQAAADQKVADELAAAEAAEAQKIADEQAAAAEAQRLADEQAAQTYIPPAPAPAPAAPAPAPVVPEPAPAAAYYPNCSAARAAGAAPVYAGGPGYGTHLDRDGDGVACE
ncbi:excalibur calcium-binding domain-containing protein [Arthrobacter sp. zg-Y820]|nr:MULTISPECIES: excalibur calcium-binding domain-containing protein [unclassified Arthrobacter]MCC9195346.1 excalibur calcium-binding domain-containing protein [Arthrobacter sp. zg-Y820]MDK1278205.1 excalibur calcium-binding domain-containing protein [Arthrobacter sp. zg.Y820]MDK1361318.1 excalibur calcium-binding domain-containing protein [Arthrobacter sp. zg-Y1219]